MARTRDRNVPVHQRVSDAIRARIDLSGHGPEGTWGPGDQLPGENALADMFGCHRQTIRTALGNLEEEGLLHRPERRGTFVRQYAHHLRRMTTTVDGRAYAVADDASYDADLADADYRIEHDVQVEVVRADVRVGLWGVGELLGLGDGQYAAVHRTDRVLTNAPGGEQVESTADWYVHHDIAAGTPIAEPEPVDVPAALADAGHPAATVRITQLPRMPQATERDRLGVLSGTAIIETVSVYRAADDTPVAIRHELAPGTGVQLVWELPLLPH